MDRLTVFALRAKTGDRSALEALIRETSPEVYRLCRYLGSPSDPDDLTQETYERAIKALHRFRGTGPARSWILSIARRVAIDATRTNIRRRSLLEKHHGLNRAEAHHDHSWLEIEQLLERLDPDRREAFVLTQLLGMSYREAAEVAGCPIGTIRSRVARARDDLLDDQSVVGAFSA